MKIVSITGLLIMISVGWHMLPVPACHRGSGAFAMAVTAAMQDTASDTASQVNGPYINSLSETDEKLNGAPADFFMLQVEQGQVLTCMYGRTERSNLQCLVLLIRTPDHQHIRADGQFGAECTFVVSQSGPLYLAATTCLPDNITMGYTLEISGLSEPVKKALIQINAAVFNQKVRSDKPTLVQTDQVTWGDAPLPADKKITVFDFNPGCLEYAILALVNEERAREKLAPLTYHFTLNQTARQHSEEMARLNYFDHKSPVPKYKSIKERIFNVYHYSGHKIAENIGLIKKISPNGEWNLTYDFLARDVMKNWMDSSDHRHNILRKEMIYLGVGCACVVDGETILFYFTQDFGGE
jgi:hypothetical protein